jgi:hypothetical protein
VYYGGALKMFFTSKTTIPFESRKDVINAYPEWTMKFKKSEDMIFMHKADIDPVYKEFWLRASNNLEEVRYNSIAEAMLEVSQDQVVIHVHENFLKHHFKRFPNTKIPTTFLSEGDNFGEYMTVTENSPLAPIFDKEFKRLCENGIVHAIRMKWFGNDLPKEWKVNNPSELSQGQVSMVFIILSCAVIASILVLTAEWIYVSFERNKNNLNSVKE